MSRVFSWHEEIVFASRLPENHRTLLQFCFRAVFQNILLDAFRPRMTPETGLPWRVTTSGSGMVAFTG